VTDLWADKRRIRCLSGCDRALERDPVHSTLVAVAQDRGRLRRFEQEAQAVAALNHPNIVGYGYTLIFRHSMDLEALQGDPAFEALLKPKD
jgi:hypothetical protein